MARRVSEGQLMTAETARYLDEAAAARFLNISARTLQRWRVDGGGPPFIRAGARRVLYDAVEIERWAAGRSFPHRASELARTGA
jgi:predicted DNA-binding transcriptional regulator AlpA